MESKNNIDKLFKDKLGNREFDIKESFLADLEGKLDAQKPRKKLWWMFFYSLIALVGVSVLTYIVSTNNVNDTIDPQVTMEETEQYVVSNKVKNTEIESVENIVDLDTDAFQEEHRKVDIYTAKKTSTDRINKELQQEVNKELPGNISNQKYTTKKTNTLNNNEEPSTSRNGESKTASVNDSEKYITVASDSQTEVKEGTVSSILTFEKVNALDQELKEINSKASNREIERVNGKNEGVLLAKESLTETENETLLPVGLGTVDTNSSSVVLNDNNNELVASNKESMGDSISIKENTSTELIASKDSVVIDEEIAQITSDIAVPDILTNENEITTLDFLFIIFSSELIIN